MSKYKALDEVAGSAPAVFRTLADEVRAEMAAEKAAKLDKFQLEAQRKAKEASKPPIKASEAYGQHEGSYIKPIFYDRMQVDLSRNKFGGPGFSGIQLIDPEYAKARAVAGVTDQKMGTRILNRNKAQVPKGAKVIWTPSVGSLEQHKSNSTMFSEFADIFANQRKKMSPEQIQKLSDKASTEVDNKGRLIFPNGIDLGSRNFRKAVKTYDQRALMADIFAGRGVGGEKGRTVPMEQMLQKNLDPNMAQAGTLDLGNRLFRLDDNVIDRPDLHSDYPKILTGEDLDVNYLPTPIASVFEDFKAAKELEKGRDITQMDYTKNDPTQLLSEDLLTRMQKAGYRKGGLAHMAGGGVMRGMKALRRIADDVEVSMPSARRASKIPTSPVGKLSIIKDTGGNWTPSGEGVYMTGLDRELEKLQKGKFDTSSKVIMHHMALDEAAGNTARKAQMERALAEALKKEAANKWVDSNLRNYVQKQMATKDDPVRKLAEEGITAFPKNVDEYGDLELRDYGGYYSTRNRERTGNDTEGVAKSPLAKHYETMTDESIEPTAAKYYQRIQALPKIQRPAGVPDMPWLGKLDPETPIFSLSREADFNKLGFDHIMDVLREDLAAGRIRPEQLNKISIEQAVRRTHEYDETLKANMLNARIAEQANANVFKEYPEGFKWVQLDKPGQFSLESDIMGHSVRGYEPPKGHPDYTDISGDSGYDTYGHGGWNAIKSGDAKIYSLRDPKGMSHATIEVGKAPLRTWDDVTKAVGKEKAAALHKEFYEIGADRTDNTEAALAMFLANKGVQPPEFISQIKGKSNAAPIESYEPYVQDFVKSGDWSEVGDLSNTGLRDVRFMTNPDVYKKYLERGLKVPKYATEKELDELHNQYLRLAEPRNYKPPEEGMAKGGVAKAAKKVMSLADEVKAEMAAEKQYGQVSGMVSKMGEEGRSPIIPVPNRWFLQPDKFPNQQKLVERVLQQTGMSRSDFMSGAFIDPRTGEVLDSRIVEDLGVVIDPKTNRPMMSAKGMSGLEQMNPKTGSYTKSNLVRKGLFKPEGGDPLLSDLNFIATIEKGDVGHKYGLATEYASPTELFNTGTGANPTLRPRSRGDLFGVGDVVGQVRIGRSDPHDVYEKLFVAPKGSDVQGKKLSKAKGGLAHMDKGGSLRAGKAAKTVMSLADEVRAEMAAEKAAKLANPPANVKVEPAFPYADRLKQVKPVYGARKILPREQADANKAAFLEPSVVKDRMYHGTRRNFTRFSPTTADSIFVTPDPTFASGFAHGALEFKDPFSDVAHGRYSTPNTKFADPDKHVDNANVLPVRVQVKNPFDYDKPEHVEALRQYLYKNSGLPKDHIDRQLQTMTDPELSANWTQMEHPTVQRAIKNLGHDAYYTKELDTKNLGIYNPNAVKSDIGNIGTWRLDTPEMTEKKGGLIATSRTA